MKSSHKCSFEQLKVGAVIESAEHCIHAVRHHHSKSEGYRDGTMNKNAKLCSLPPLYRCNELSNI